MINKEKNKMMKKKIFVLLSIGFLVFSMAGLSNAVEEYPTPLGDLGDPAQEYPFGPPPWKFGFSQVDLANVWKVQFEAELEYELSKPAYKDIKFYRTVADSRSAKQISDMEDLMVKGMDIILISPISPTAQNSVIERAYDLGIPVVTTCSRITTDKYMAAVSGNNYEYGYRGGKWLAEVLNGKGKIIAIRGYPGDSIDIDRYTGMRDAIKEYPGIELVGEDFGFWDLARGKRVAEELLAVHPDLDGAWSCGGSISRGFMAACLEAGMEVPLPINGGDSENGYLKMWKEYQPKGFKSIVSGYPVFMGQVAAQVVLKILKGEPYEKVILLTPEPITDENLDEYVHPDMPDKMYCLTHLPDEILKSLYPPEK